MSRNYTLINYIFINKVYLKIFSYLLSLWNFSTISFPLLSFFWEFFISSTLILQMANTSNRNANANAENNGENNNDANPPWPPPPTLEQVLAMQAQMLQTMVNMHNAQCQVPPPPLRDRLRDFQRTKPPTFSHIVESMDADDWLKFVKKKKLQVVQCNNHEKVLLDSHQVSRPAVDWWDAYVEAHEKPESINWPKVRATFHAHHVTQGVTKLKKEFQDLK
jgi:hypothetical protein